MENENQVETNELKNNREDRNVNINQNSPEILTNNIYTPAFLRENIGKLMRVEFLIGTNNLVDRTGILIDVGASYILLRALESDIITYADIYSIKFITISNLPYNMLFNLNTNNMNSNSYINSNNIPMQNMHMSNMESNNYRY